MAGQRIAKTADGRYVLDSHPDAVMLVYSQHDEPPPDVLAKMKVGPPRDKQRRKPRNKASEKPADGDE